MRKKCWEKRNEGMDRKRGCGWGGLVYGPPLSWLVRSGSWVKKTDVPSRSMDIRVAVEKRVTIISLPISSTMWRVLWVFSMWFFAGRLLCRVQIRAPCCLLCHRSAPCWLRFFKRQEMCPWLWLPCRLSPCWLRSLNRQDICPWLWLPCRLSPCCLYSLNRRRRRCRQDELEATPCWRCRLLCCFYRHH
ncbi:hypothetical protein F4778DRAFT_452320 [Xylariomycetidae sp. FL2044]|nr:hypothetical protein F4778DRAFT_452320 [Xylariomycetidae sp. FL2044]